MSTPTRGGNLTASFPFTAAADLERRTIHGTTVEYGVTGNTSWGPTVIEAGAITVPDRVVMLASHDPDRPVGLLAEHADADDRMVATFRVAATPAGDTALLEASEGLRNGLSVGLSDIDYTTADDGTVVITAATLREVSLVTFPAFDGARVTRVAASEHPETSEPDPGTEDTTEGDTVDESTAVAEATDAAPLTAAAPVADLPRARVQDPFPYRPGVRASFFADMVKAEHDPDAKRRFEQAQAMLQAAQTSTNVAEVIPQLYRPDLYVGALANTRPVIDSFSQFSIDGPNPFRVPKWETASGLISDHVEGTNPSDGTIAFDEQVITPVAKSGKYTASREMIEGSNPSVDAIIMNAIREEYALDTEAYAITTFLAGATAGTVVDISDGVTMQVRQRFITFQSNRKRSAEVFLAGETLFSELAKQVDSTGRPLNPSYGPSNATGLAGPALESIEVAGRVTPLVPVLTGGLLGVRSDAATFESGLRMWRWEEKAGPANIEFAAFGYIVCAVFRATGLLKFATQA